MFIVKPDQKLLTVLKKIREATVNELGIKTKISDSSLYRLLKKLEEQGKVTHRYLKGNNSQRYVKHYRLTRNEVK